MQHVKYRFLPDGFSHEKFQPAALWSLASLSSLSAPAVQHNQKHLNCQEKAKLVNLIVFVIAAQKRNDLLTHKVQYDCEYFQCGSSADAQIEPYSIANK